MTTAQKAAEVVPLADRHSWTLAEFALILGRSHQAIYKNLEWTTPLEGVIRLPGVNVPVHRHPRGDAIVYRLQFQDAVRAGAGA